jgi:cell division septal protein FtsQ
MNDPNNEKKESASNRSQEQEKILEEYLKPKRIRLKYWRYLFLFIVSLLLMWIYKSCVLAEKIIAAIKWVEGTVIDCFKQVAG